MTGRRSIQAYSLALALTLAAAARAALPPAPPGFELKGDPAHGKTVFASRCALCHGPTGNGKGKIKTAGAPPADFTDAAEMAKRSDWEIYLVIRDGGPVAGRSAKMFGWGKLLPDQDLRDAAAYVRSLAAKGG